MAYRKIFQCSTVTKSAFEMKHHLFFRDSEYKPPVYQCEGSSDKHQKKALLWCRKCNKKVFSWQSILYFIPENADSSFSPCLKCASSIIQIPIFKPCFGKCILCGTCVIDYALLSAVIVYNTPQSSTGWRYIYYRQWCQCWSVLIGHFKTKARQKGICFQWLVRLVLEVSSWCFSPYVGIQLPVFRGPFHWGPPP